MSSRVRRYLHFLKSLAKINNRMLRAMWKFTKLKKPSVTVFGGARFPQEYKHAKTIYQITNKLVSEGYTILTGGGAGLMEAANYGALEYFNNHKPQKKKKIVSMGIGVARLGGANKHVQEFFTLPYFFARKWLLVRNAAGFIVGPGGFGTLDELSEILTLIQTHNMPNTPIVLIGKEYWQPFLDWVYNSALKHHCITEEDAKLLNLTDDPDEACRIITSKCKEDSPIGIDAESKEEPEGTQKSD